MSANTDESTDELPHPRTDPEIAYAHEGKRYEVFGQGEIEIVRYEPDALDGMGIVVVEWVHKEGAPCHETERTDSGVADDLLNEYVVEYDDEGAVMSVPLLMKEVRNFNIGEVNPNSYDDVYYGEGDL
jgi:hypothetical protein